ncbi:MAG: chemotaxis protein CheW, partial [Burkholderiaceae bacterium]|nr:chemotaxis protein CheW [Burkholderiaceae bacterium]
MTSSPAESSLDNTPESNIRIERRKRLRQFQSELVERMQAAREQTEAHDNRLGFVAGQTKWLLNLQEIGEIVPVTAITKVPLTKNWYLGLINIRGNLVGVIDWASYQGLAPTLADSASRIITFAPVLGINCGLLVSRVMGLRNVAQMEPYSDSDEKTEAWVGQKYHDNES